MPSFNKGVFENVEYEAIPVGRFRIISSVFRWYRPYAPGSHIDFKLKVRSLIKGGSGIRIVLKVREKETSLGNYFCKDEWDTIKVNGISLSEETKYLLQPVFPSKNSEIIVSVDPFHNDIWVVVGGTAIITFLFSILLWLISGFFVLEPFWRFWIP